MTKYHESSYSMAGKASGRLRTSKMGPRQFLHGTILTPLGIVSVRHSINDHTHPSTIMEMVVGGRLHRRLWFRAYTRKALATLAHRFAKDLQGQEMPDQHPAITSILKYFTYDHLPVHLQVISKPFGELAIQLAERQGTDGPETTVALRKLLESKDAAVRAALAG